MSWNEKFRFNIYTSITIGLPSAQTSRARYNEVQDTKWLDRHDTLASLVHTKLLP